MIFKNSDQKHTAGLNLKNPKIMSLHEDVVKPLQVFVPIPDKMCILLEVMMKMADSHVTSLRFHLQARKSGGSSITLKVLNQHTFQVETSAKK